MTGWAPKRFWKQAGVDPVTGGFAVRLDGRPVKTPAKAPLVVPTRALAEAMAAEWDAQTGTVRPQTMPLTRTANSAIDKLALHQPEVVSLLADYGDADLLCYRAEKPPALADRQAQAWDPILDWAAQALGARLAAARGVIHIPQDPQALAALTAEVAALDRFRLAAFHDLVAIPGSLVLALAVTRGRLDPETAWALSRIDEDWQIAEWGADEEATEAAALKRAAFLDAHRFFELCR